jgi:hypothetical protein
LDIDAIRRELTEEIDQNGPTSVWRDLALPGTI